MKKKTNLDSGFLILYDWLPVLELLPAKEVKALLLALIARQRENKPLPSFRNPTTDGFARMIEPVICRRLEGAMWAKKSVDPQGDPSGDPMWEPDGQEDKKEELSEETEKKITDECISAEQREEAPAPPAASRALSEQEKALLIEEGLPAAYIEAREARACAFASSSGRDVLAVLCAWWKQDKRSFNAAQKKRAEQSQSSFDVEDFWEAACRRPFGERTSEENEISPATG